MFLIKQLFQRLDAWLFASFSAVGFSLMRIAWGAQELITFGFQWPKVHMYYTSGRGIEAINCNGSNWPLSWQFLLDGRFKKAFIDSRCLVEELMFSEQFVNLVFLLLITSLILVIIGYYPKLFIGISLFIIIMLHQRNSHITNGGDRIERTIPFFLLLAPSIYLFSVQKAKRVWNTRWVYYLLLWQLIIFYVTAGSHKLEVVGWTGGEILSISLHLEQFVRFPIHFFNIFEPWYVPMGLVTVGVQIVWILHLTPHFIRKRLVWKHYPLTLKQTIILGTALMHTGILIFMDVDMFSVTLLVSYVGLIDETDIAFFKRCKEIATLQKNRLKKLLGSVRHAS